MFRMVKRIVVFLSISLLVLAENSNPEDSTQQSNLLQDEELMARSNISVSSRKKRSLDENVFNEYMSRLTASARLFSAISLQIGLADESIRADTALAELMNVGKLDLAALENFKKPLISAVLANVSALSKRFQGSNRKNEEIAISLLDSWKRLDFGDLKNSSIIEKYFQNVEQVKAVKINRSVFSDAVQPVEDLLEKLKVIGLPEFDPTSDQCVAIHNSVRDFEPHWTAILQEVKSIEKLQSLIVERSLVDSPQWKLLEEMIKNRRRVADANVKEFGDIFRDYEALNAVVGSASGASLDVNNMHTVIRSRHSAFSDRSQTAGLINGYADLRKLSEDINLEQFRGFRIDLKSVLQPLELLHAAATELGNVWDSTLKAPGHMETTEKIKMLWNELTPFTKFPTVTSQSVKVIAEFVKQIPPLGRIEAKYVFDGVEAIRPILFSTTTFGTAISKMEMESLFELRDSITVDATNGIPNLPEVIKKMKGIDFSKLTKTLTKLKHSLERLGKEKTDELQQSFIKLSGGDKEVKNFMEEDETKRMIQFFKEVKQLPEEVRTMAASIRLKKMIEELDGKFFSSAEELVTTFDTSLRPSLPALRATGENVKEPQKEEFMMFKDLKDDTTAFGGAVNVLHNIRKILENERLFEKFSEDDSFVQELINDAVVKSTTTQSKRRLVRAVKSKAEQMRDNWKGFDEIQKKVGDVWAAVNKRRDEIVRLDATKDFKDFDSLFAGLPGIPNFDSADLDLDRKLSVLDSLNPSGNQQIADLKAAFRTLDALDLQFQRFAYSLHLISRSLPKLDVALAVAKGQKPSSGETSMATSSPKPTTSRSTTDKNLQEEKGKKEVDVWTISVIAVVIILIIVVIVVLVCLDNKYWKLRRKLVAKFETKPKKKTKTKTVKKKERRVAPPGGVVTTDSEVSLKMKQLERQEIEARKKAKKYAMKKSKKSKKSTKTAKSAKQPSPVAQPAPAQVPQRDSRPDPPRKRDKTHFTMEDISSSWLERSTTTAISGASTRSTRTAVEIQYVED